MNFKGYFFKTKRVKSYRKSSRYTKLCRVILVVNSNQFPSSICPKDFLTGMSLLQQVSPSLYGSIIMQLITGGKYVRLLK